MEINNKHQVNWNKSALIIIDMQNFFYGNNPQIPIDKSEDIITPIKNIIHQFRKNGSRIVWTKSHHETIKEGIYKQLNPYHFDNGKPFLLKSSSYFDIIPELSDFVNNSDIIIEKERYNAFFKTNLHEKLLTNGITDLYFCGVTTNVCVESTIRTAFEQNYNSILFEDATSSINKDFKETSIKLIKYVFGEVIMSQSF